MDKVAVLWPNLLKAEEWGRDQPDLLIYEGIGIEKAAATALEAERAGAKGIICTQGIRTEVQRVISIPTHVVSIAYIDLLETLHELETLHGVRGKRIAILLHSNNGIIFNRVKPYVNNEIREFLFTDLSEVPGVLDRMKELHYDILLAGPTGNSLAGHRFSSVYTFRYTYDSILNAATQMRLIINLNNREMLQLQKLRATINSSVNAMVILDERGCIDIMNEKAVKLFQNSKTGDNLIGRRFAEVLKAADVKEHDISGRTEDSGLVSVGEAAYFVTQQSIELDGTCVGTVNTYEEVEKIQELETRYRALQSKGLVAKHHFCDIINESAVMKKTIELAKAYAATDLTVLIEGETGTGKELFAQSIHNASNRRYGPFVAFNCAALSESLLESELMGYEAGAFTGAKKSGKMGLLELAHNGTIFLDEINQLPMYLQSKLLRVIQERSVLRVGGERIIPIDIRIIASTNESLEEKVRRHEFRNDLYYRLNILNLQLMPLRRRRDDIEPLMRSFLSQMGFSKKDMLPILKAVIEQTLSYDWPGNVRELQNYVWRTSVFQSNHIALNDGLLWRRPGRTDTESPEDGFYLHYGTLQELKKQIIEKTVEYCHGNKTEAAKLLGINRNTIGNSARKKS